jgi:hypothetical protein
MMEAAFDCDRSAVLGDDPLRNGQAQSRAPLSTASSFVDSEKAFENSGLLFFGDSHSRILDSNYRTLGFRCERQMYGAAWGGVLESVVEQDIDQPSE